MLRITHIFINLQIKVLDILEKLIEKNDFSKRSYAYLLDRVAINSNQLQRYGTQIKNLYGSTLN